MSKKPARKNDAPLSQRQQRIYDFLRTNNVGVLATVDPNGEPHATVIYYAIDEHFTVTFLTKTGTKKYDNLARHNDTVLVVFEPASQTVAQVIGTAVKITAGYDVNEVAANVFRTYADGGKNDQPPLVKLEAGDYTAFEIEPGQIRMATYSRPESGDYENVFESIESFELNDTGN